MGTPLRIDPEQRFSCSQCGRCCHRFDVVVSTAEIDLYRRRNAVAWFRDDRSDEADPDLSTEAQQAKVEPFEPMPGMPALQRIRKRADGACGFLSANGRCRIHEELGAARKPLTCRLFPYAFHTAADGVVVTASFGCPTVAANEGTPIGAKESLIEIESLRREWFAANPQSTPCLQLVDGRIMEPRALFQLRRSLLTMFNRESDDIRENIARIAEALDDVTRQRVVALADDDFAEYVSLTLPHGATKKDAPPRRSPDRIVRMLQYGFLYAVTAIRADLEHPGQSKWRLRVMRLQLLAHFHGLAPGLARVRVAARARRRVDINDPDIRPIVFHYLRSTLETLGAHGRPIVDELSIAVSYLNAACGLAAMTADAAGRNVDRRIFIEALTEAADVSHARHVVLDWVLKRLSAGTGALWHLSEV